MTDNQVIKIPKRLKETRLKLFKTQKETALIIGYAQNTVSENESYSSGTYGGWNQHPLFPTPRKTEISVLDNKTVRVLLPISFDGSTKEYMFTFTVKWSEYAKKKKK